MDVLELQVTQKDLAHAKAIRKEKRIPIIYYGKGIDNQRFSADYQEFRRTYNKGGRSTIINLINEDKKEFPVLVHEIQYHPVSDDIIHVDVKAVEMGKLIQTDVSFVFVGTAPAVKELGGIFVHAKKTVRVECLPRNLIHEIKIDISSLIDFSCAITVADLKVPETITILDAPEINIATVSAPRVIEEEEVAPDEGTEGEEGGEGAGEEGEGKEGEEGEKKKEGESKAKEGGGE